MIIGQYYTQLLDRFDDALKQKRPHLAKKKVLFHQANAPAHALGYELLPHPPYSPDLHPSVTSSCFPT
jgi:histone-lysine N-methyltransferase SETMAR